MAWLDVTEAQFQRTVLDLAAVNGWHHFHPLNMRGSDPGWPDLTLARPPEILWAELKSERGRLSRAQRYWIELLRSCGLEVHVWRPRDWDAIVDRLRS